MSYRTLEVEIDHGTVVAKGGDPLPVKASGLLTIIDSLRRESAPELGRKRVTAPLIQCKPGSVINPTRSDLDDSLWD